ncbi:MAG: sulfite exporter TauE/SafE family protein [Pelagimonas sp.]|jgi:uncharacterized membrane protein YfcA|nr:sulfite exporter TauE/SafE family protein [Pelagimonas sp.]
MPEIWSGLTALPAQVGLGWIVLAAFLGGMVRGFTGFGTALVYLPVAAQFLDPFIAIITLTIMDVVGPVPLVPRAWREAARRDLVRLCLAMALSLPLGLWVLSLVAPELFRYTVSFLALGMLVVLASGLRWKGAVRGRMVAAIGAVSGFLGGIAGLPGPPVILFYMARPLPVQVIRATILLFLLIFDLVLLGYLGLWGRLDLFAVGLGLALIVPNMAGGLLGGRLFDPAREWLYRGAAYIIIAVSGLSGLPFFG